RARTSKSRFAAPNAQRRRASGDALRSTIDRQVDNWPSRPTTERVCQNCSFAFVAVGCGLTATAEHRASTLRSGRRAARSQNQPLSAVRGKGPVSGCGTTRQESASRTAGGVTHPVRSWGRSEEHTSELQSRENLVCRL